MRVSVVIPTYNRASFIGATIDAVLAQTSPPDEVIVVDDGSTDATRTVLDSYGEKVRHILITNSGDLVARNIGLQASRGELIAFCDSDDIWLPDFLKVMVKPWAVEPDLLACFSDFYILQDGVLSKRSKFESAPPSYWNDLRLENEEFGFFYTPIVDQLLQYQPFFPSCLMIKKDRFCQLGAWDEGVSRMIGCDFATALRIGAHPPVGIVRTPLVAIRKHRDNISGNSERMALGDAKVLEFALETRPELAKYRVQIVQSIAQRRCAALDLAFDRMDFEQVTSIQAMIPTSYLAPRQKLKKLIASLPRPVAYFLTTMLAKRNTQVHH